LELAPLSTGQAQMVVLRSLLSDLRRLTTQKAGSSWTAPAHDGMRHTNRHI
jgi:hypothetical protein